MVYDMLQAFVDPQTLGLLVKFSATPGKVCTGAPLYGEHIRQVLHEYRFDDQQIDSFEKEGHRVRNAVGTVLAGTVCACKWRDVRHGPIGTTAERRLGTSFVSLFIVSRGKLNRGIS